jgi:hypothetical protein
MHQPGFKFKLSTKKIEPRMLDEKKSDVIHVFCTSNWVRSLFPSSLARSAATPAKVSRP